MTERVMLLTVIVAGFGLLYLVVELRSPSGERVNPRAAAVSPPSVMVVAGPPQEPQAIPHRLDVHHHHHLTGLPARPEIIDGEVVASELIGGG